MGWRTKAEPPPTELPHDLLAAYEPTRVPAGRTTGLPAAPRDRVEPEQEPPTPTIRVTGTPSLVLVPPPDLDEPRPEIDPVPVARRAARGEAELRQRNVDRRSTVRHTAVLPVLATLPGDDEGALGHCMNVTEGGLLVAMPMDAPDRHLDLLVGDDDCALIWVKVVAERPAEDGVLWHLQVVTADDAWHELVARVSAVHRTG